MENIFLQISIILLIVLGVSFIVRLLKQPLIIGYIISGIIVGPLMLNLIPNTETLQTFSEFGVAFLLFIVGIHLSPKVIKEVGKISLITGIGQVVFTSVIGYFIGIWLGFSPVTSAYIAVALTFSSTIIIMKLLSDKDSLDRLFGKISIGFLLVQDLIAIIILIVVSSFSNGVNASEIIVSTFVKGGIIVVFLLPISYLVLPRLSSFFAKSQELLYLFAISWGLGLSALFLYAGFSIEVGALVAGIMLSISPYSYEVSSKLRPLRDFFIISFFILLGAQMIVGNLAALWIPAVVFSVFILVGNPLIVMILMGIFGYSKNTGFMAGLTVAQISEFSLILIALGVRVGHLTNEILSLVTLVGLITIAGSTYMIMYSEKIYSLLSKYLSVFERKKTKREKDENKDYEYILLGENRIGFSIMKSFVKLRKNYVVIDFNPERVRRLSSNRINCIYGDVSNADFIDNLRVKNSKLIVSTIPEAEINLMLIEKIRAKNRNAVIITTARQISDVYSLYKTGADYVILPHFLGGEYTAKLIEKADGNKKYYSIEKQKQLKDLKERLKEGQEHPHIEK
ncbi:cation:proton antiporter [Candidatus Pacearchaeota archaeon]|nr:cation:proton antiporter [Candidatus Pacearchaeota archaeon]